ncbi:MAG TPA: ubiquinol-cytochrome c reductase iron-sulfur subunit [Pirellulales bacterium]|nr:ubiquinol-cytochrome c reductase iron-sulfur subunit [Pirellulales bacterium]
MHEIHEAAGSLPSPVSPEPGRRGFFRLLTGVMSVVASLAVAVPFVDYLLGRRRREVKWAALDSLHAFPVGETRQVTFDNPLRQPWDGMVSRTSVYVRNEGQGPDGQPKFLVLAVNCAHLGCPVSWFSQSGLFMCPCHGGVYYADGQRAAGPPPRGLYHCLWRVRDGRLEVQAPHYPTLQDTLTEPA